MSVKFVRVSDGFMEEIIPIRDLIKVYKAEGFDGEAIIYEFDRLHNGLIEQWREEYSSRTDRDRYFYRLVEVLCGLEQVPFNDQKVYRERQKRKEFEDQIKEKEEERERFCEGL